MNVCKGCNNNIHQLAAACPHCGLSQRSRAYKNKNVAGLLAIIFGAFSAHALKDSLTTEGLLTFWTLIPSIISFVEAIVFWCANTDKWDVKYNQNRPASPTEQIYSNSSKMAVAVMLT